MWPNSTWRVHMELEFHVDSHVEFGHTDLEPQRLDLLKVKPSLRNSVSTVVLSDPHGRQGNRVSDTRFQIGYFQK